MDTARIATWLEVLTTSQELYEPLWDDLQQRSMNGKGFRIRGIWVADMSNQGESGVLNEENTGNERTLYRSSQLRRVIDPNV